MYMLPLTCTVDCQQSAQDMLQSYSSVHCTFIAMQLNTIFSQLCSYIMFILWMISWASIPVGMGDRSSQ